MRVVRVLVDPKQPETIVEHMKQMQRAVDGGIEFGSPQDPTNPVSTTVANGAVHNGTVVNILGSWVEISLGTGDLAVDTTCTHNLNVDIVSAAMPVRWIVFGWKHNATGVGAGSVVSAVYEGGTISADAIALRFYATARTVNDANPLVVSLFFIPAVR